MFPVNGSLRMAPLFARSGPGESGSPMSLVILRCYDFPLRSPVTYSFRFRAPRDPPRFVSRCLRSGKVGGTFLARIIVHPATQSAGLFARGRKTGSPRFPGDPFRAFAPLSDPGRTDNPSPLDGIVDAAPTLPTARASALNEFRGSITRLQHLLSTLHE